MSNICERCNKDKGHIQLCSISSFKNYAKDYDLKLFIVRSPGKIDYEKYGMVHVPELSPSPELFKKYKARWSKGIFTKIEQQRLKELGPDSTWWDLYIPEFLNEMTGADAQVNIKRMIELLDEGTNILLVCFCADSLNCHRGLIGDHFNNMGYEVRY